MERRLCFTAFPGAFSAERPRCSWDGRAAERRRFCGFLWDWKRRMADGSWACRKIERQYFRRIGCLKPFPRWKISGLCFRAEGGGLPGWREKGADCTGRKRTGRESRVEQLQEIREALSELGIIGAAQDQPVLELSGGMRRRVAIARAVLAGQRFGPEGMILFDEPFDGLDAETKAGASGFIRKNCVGKTVIMITHSEEGSSAHGWNHCPSVKKYRKRGRKHG